METNQKLSDILLLVLELNSKRSGQISLSLHPQSYNLSVFELDNQTYTQLWKKQSYYSGSLVDYKDDYTCHLSELESFLKTLMP